MKNLDCPRVDGHPSFCQRMQRNWPAVQRLSALPELTQTGRGRKLGIMVTANELPHWFPSATSIQYVGVWDTIYHPSCSGSYTPPCCCIGCHCLDNHHKWMICRCWCLGHRRTWGRQRGRDQHLASPHSALQTNHWLLLVSVLTGTLPVVLLIYLSSHQQHCFSYWMEGR